MIQNHRISTTFISALLVCYPTLALAVKGGVNAVFFVLVGFSLYVIYILKSEGTGLNLDRTTGCFSVAMLLPTLAVLANQVSIQSFDPHPYDVALRFLLAPLIYIALRNFRTNIVAALEIAFPLGAIASVAVTVASPRVDGRAASYFLSAIHFGDLALMLGFLSLFSINWKRSDPKWVLILKVSGLLAGLYTSIESGTRGGWLAIPVLVTLWLFFANMKKRIFSPYLGILIVLLACLASYFSINMVQQRVDRAISNLASYASGHVDSGTAARLELWKASFYMFSEHPFFGVGPDGFKQMLAMMRDKGEITELVVIEGNMEAHSEIAGNLARYGALGLISILSLYLIPIWIFFKNIRSSFSAIAVAAMMGIGVSVGFLIFGLTVETFNIKMIAAFYSLTITCLLAIASSNPSEADKHNRGSCKTPHLS